MNKQLKAIDNIISQMERLQTLQLTAQSHKLTSYPLPDYGKVITNLATAATAMTAPKTVEEGAEDAIPF